MHKALSFFAVLFILCAIGNYLLQFNGEPARLEYSTVRIPTEPVIREYNGKLVRKLFELMDIQNTAQNISEAMAEQIRSQAPEMTREIVEENIYMTDDELDHYLQLVLPDYMEKFFDEVFAVMDTDKMVEEIFVPLYMENFEASEIRDMIRFYKSPAGMKMVEMSPQITARSLSMMMDLYGEQITSRVKQISQEIVVDIEQRMWDDMFSEKYEAKERK